jgi:DNA-binding MarR family transcriptional regulator
MDEKGVYTPIVRKSAAHQKACEAAAQTCACFNIRKVARAVTQFYDQALRPTGLRTTQFTVLTAVRLRGPVTVSQLAHGLVMDRTTLTRDLGLLEDEGLIRIESGDDRRERRVSLTPKGEKALARALPLWQGVQERVRKNVGAERFHRLLHELSAVLRAIRQA